MGISNSLAAYHNVSAWNVPDLHSDVRARVQILPVQSDLQKKTIHFLLRTDVRNSQQLFLWKKNRVAADSCTRLAFFIIEA